MKSGKLNVCGMWLAVLALVLTFGQFGETRASSNAVSERAYKLAQDALSKKLQNDLAAQDLRVQIGKVDQYSASNSEFGIKGSGVFSLASVAEKHQIDFDVKISQNDFRVINVEYNFIPTESAAENALAAMEEAVSQKLLKQLAADFKSNAVVVALDSINQVENRLEGTAEIRINDFRWSKATFEVVLSGKGLIESVKYEIQD